MTEPDRDDENKLKKKDWLTLGMSTLSLVVSLGSFSATATSCSTSRDALNTAKHVAQVNENDLSGHFSPTFLLQEERNEKTNFTRVDAVYGPTKISRSEAESPGTWLDITVTNTGNRVVTILNLGLVSDLTSSAGIWFTQIPEMDVPDFCSGDTGADKDVRCFSFPYNIEVGKSATFHWPLTPDMIEPVLNGKGGDPVIVGFTLTGGSNAVKTALTIQ